MAKLLLNLHNVPDDEADDVRAFLDAARIEHYETRPSPFGISAGGIWVRNDADLPEAKRRMADYQRERALRVRAEQAQAERDGTAETFADIVRAQPLRVVMIIVAIALLLGLVALPAILIGR
ncbi:hypothetical protein FQY83_00475 [Luteimonas marina]|uniref:DUF2007 domain-containing protein n=1 Tax=Luteimonas marina TaxID=488485 RepID=A0A5C5UAX6_9GAMM|nr:DUF6164 family protein [Luteimonas marina]TWT23166.1 hypothetical protein FQY83_00475 [Luteimonas marina]